MVGLAAVPTVAAQSAHPTAGSNAVNLGTVNVGSSSTVAMIGFTFDTGGELNATIPYQVLTQGAPKLDFTDAGGSTCAGGVTYKSGDKCSLKVIFTPTRPGTRYGAAELLDGAGNLVALGYIRGTGVGPQTTFSNATTGDYLPNALSNLGGGFGSPMGLAVDASGNIFVAEYGGGAVKEILAQGGYTTVNTLGSGFDTPAGVAVDGAGNVFVADYHGGAVDEIVAAGGYVTVKALGGGFNFPSDVAVDGSGNVFVSNEGARDVRESFAAGGYTTVRILGSGFVLPESVAVDGNGNVFVADWVGAVKEMVAVDGSIPASPVINTLGGGFLDPVGVAVDASGNVFVADADSTALQEIVAKGGYAKVITLVGGVMGSVAVDGSGNVYASSNNLHIGRVGQISMVEKLDYADPPSLTFADSLSGGESGDSPQTVVLANVGTAPLIFPVPETGNNPSISANFQLDSNSNSACPLIASGASAAGTLAAGTSCVLPISFEPEGADGPVTGELTLTDNNLNAVSPGYAVHTLSLNGTVASLTPPSMTSPTPGSTLTGSTVTFSWNGGFGSSGFMLKVGTTGAGSSDLYDSNGTTATSATVSDIPIGNQTVYVRLRYEMGTTWSSVNYTYMEHSPPPEGRITAVGDSVTYTSTVAQADSLEVKGWVWDTVDGAPMSNVKVYIDGALVGTPTLGVARPDVVLAQNNSALMYAGYQFVASAATLSLGTHGLTVIATDSKGESTTFGPVSFAVAATTVLGGPFGSIGEVVDSTTFSTTVGQADSLLVRGWVADPQDGAPLSNITVYIDWWTSAGTPTLGIARPDIAAKYGSAYGNAGYQLTYSVATLAIGGHQVTVIATDSGGRSKTFGPVAFTVAASAGAGPPIGAIGEAVDSTTLSSTVSPGDSLLVRGFVADPADGSPLINVKVYMDGVLAGTPTLGIARPDVVAVYHDAAYLHSGFQFLDPANSLAAGAHTVTVVAVDSGGRSKVLGPVGFTVE
ncbi:MAG TPA: hypothetical protein VHX60_06770 [Acidobacteriaceae bacterium]|nr:hypothetical protein [Acidobacteriaceae bacterium]